jgi:multisubunit Na+/H+ antiporter MnhE subunit
MDKKFVFLLPFLISFIICNNSFAADIITLGLIANTIISFAIFNIKNKLNHIKSLQYIFILSSLLAYFSFFYNDHDLAT